jgi:hypothetical protein
MLQRHSNAIVYLKKLCQMAAALLRMASGPPLDKDVTRNHTIHGLCTAQDQACNFMQTPFQGPFLIYISSKDTSFCDVGIHLLKKNLVFFKD